MDPDKKSNDHYMWYEEYSTRKQTWLRRKIYNYTAAVDMQLPCSVMHVRRGDVALFDGYWRPYLNISDYVSATNRHTLKHNVLLLTDDKNAIDEAKRQYPAYNWMYLDRPRHKGSEGGWQSHRPSGDPALEVTIVLSILRLVRKCDTLVCGESGFADTVWHHMKDEKGDNATLVRIEHFAGHKDLLKGHKP